MSTSTQSKQPFKDKLRYALDRKQIGITELARRVSAEAQGKDVEAARRAIHKHLKGEAQPRREMRRRYETALGLEMGDLEPDDEEADPVSTLMSVLRALVRDEVRGIA